ncbi:hypothetical protein [Vibrio sp. D431a]|uniref:hypothetical protein n=1 Tax=Vibrio sp. D431a TaxID=2837388 RepID=UPI0025567E47|nr:hypothetical protein [Vibrio sp. D431a]MDK9790185.1 hypothetical protein [Vibrio sp. D431a]
MNKSNLNSKETPEITINHINELIHDYFRKEKPMFAYYEELNTNRKANQQLSAEYHARAEREMFAKLAELNWTPQIAFSREIEKTSSSYFEMNVTAGCFSFKGSNIIDLPKDAQDLHRQIMSELKEEQSKFPLEPKESIHFQKAKEIYEESPHKEININSCLVRSFAYHMHRVLNSFLLTGKKLYIEDTENQNKFIVDEVTSRYIGMGESEMKLELTNTSKNNKVSMSLCVLTEFGKGEPKYKFYSL